MNHKRFAVSCATALFLLSACGPGVAITNLTRLSPADLAGYRAVRILNAAQLTSLHFEVLNIVEGHSCKNKVWDPPATRAAAVEQAKFAAYKLGANAITNIDYAGTSTYMNCWESASVTAEALRVSDVPTDSTHH